jgi:hypothetical protein
MKSVLVRVAISGADSAESPSAAPPPPMHRCRRRLRELRQILMRYLF